MRNGADRRHQAKRDRQIEMAPLLRQVRRRHVHRDAPRREREAGCDECSAHALACFRDSLVGQADHIEGRQPRRDLHLHIDGASLDALECDRGNALNHAVPLAAELSQHRIQLARTFREQPCRGILGISQA